jgi:Flp pilus assembly protein TadD
VYADDAFPLLPRLTDALKDYETHRRRWPTLARFAPRLLDAFRADERERAARERARALSDQGIKAYVAGDAARAIALLRRAEREDPKDPEITLDLGVALAKAGDAKAALTAYDRAVAKALADRRRWEVAAAALSSRASLRAQLGRRTQARADLKRALGLVPADWSGRAALEAGLEALSR